MERQDYVVDALDLGTRAELVRGHALQPSDRYYGYLCDVGVLGVLLLDGVAEAAVEPGDGGEHRAGVCGRGAVEYGWDGGAGRG